MRFLRRVPPRIRLGRRGERKAVRALKRAGYRILGRNVETPVAEVDVLALDGDVLVLVEVKTTASPVDPRWPLHARLGRSQIRRLRAAARWLARRTTSPRRHVRGDLVTVAFGARRPTVQIYRDWF